MALSNTKSMTESGLLAAITVITALIGVYVPVLGTVAILIWPLPILVLEVRHGIKWALLSVLAAGIIMSILIEPMSAIRMVVGFAPPSIALGYGFRKGLPAQRTLLISLLSAMAGLLAAMGLLFVMTGINPFGLQIDSLQEIFEETLSTYEAVGMDAAQIDDTRKQFQMAFSLVTLLMPLVIICSGLVTTWINFVIGRRVLRRLGYIIPSLPQLDNWHLPKVLVYLFGFSLVGLYWGSTRQLDLLYQISLNVNILATLAGFIQGIAILSSILRNRISRWLFWLIAVFIFFNGFLAQILSLMGLFDMVFDYRGRFFKNH